MKTSIFFCFILCTSLVFSQSLNQQWLQRYNGTANSADWAYGIALDQSGNICVTGYCTNTNTGKDMMTIEYDPNGSVLWSKTYDGSNHGGDYSYTIKTDQSGNVYVTGRTDGGSSSADITTIKYNSSGVQQWVAIYDGNSHMFDEARALAIDNAGNVYVAGRTQTATNDYDVVVLKYDANGNQLWVRTYNGPGNGFDAAYSIAYDNSTSSLYVTGESYSTSTGADFILIKYNSDGVQQWVQRYNGPGNGGDAAIAVKLDMNGYIYITGMSDGGAGTNYDYATLKYDPSGSQLWLQRYNGVANLGDYAKAMWVDPTGNVYVTGITTIHVNTIIDSDFATVKYNTNGVQQWVNYYTGPSGTADVPCDITADVNGNVYVTGESFFTNQLDNYVTIKYDGVSGAAQWTMVYDGPANGDDLSSAIVTDAAGDVYVTGGSTGVGTGYDMATIKYSGLVGINPVSGVVPKSYRLGQNYPNPFNPETKIDFDIPVSSNVVMNIYNITGELVLTLLSTHFSAGTYSVTVNGTSLSSGVYFYRLSGDNFVETRKMILVK